MIDKEFEPPAVCCFCRSGGNLVQAYRTEETYAGLEFRLYISCCKACLPKLDPGYSIVEDDEPLEAGGTEATGLAIVDTLNSSLSCEIKKKTKGPKKRERRNPVGQLNLFEGEE